MTSLPAHLTPVSSPASLFRGLGFFGLESIESSVLAGLVTGDPVLLVGGHGAAKTSLVRALARAFGLDAWAYDASKALFEDLIGFPNPASLARGEIEYVPTPLSVWHRQFILVDEISRAAPSMQNKWLEVVRSRSVMGRRIEGLRYVFAAMNPPTYPGAHALDPALAGRFAFVIPMPEAKDFDAVDLAGVIDAISEDDAPLCPAAFGSPTSAVGGTLAAIRSVVEEARAAVPAVERRLGTRATEYVRAFALQLREHGVDLDGRRLGMMRRNLLAVCAVEEANGALAVSDLPAESLVRRTTNHSLPFLALGDGPTGAATHPSQATAYRVAFGGSEAPEPTEALLGRGPLHSVLDTWEARLAELPEHRHGELLNRIAEATNALEPEPRAEGIDALFRFVKVAGDHPGRVPADAIGRAMERIDALFALREPGGAGALHWLLIESDGAFSPQAGTRIDALALRAVLARAPGRGRGRGAPLDDDEALTEFARLREALRALELRKAANNDRSGGRS